MKREAQGSERLETATFAGGCFWCTEADFEKANGGRGILSVVSGYTGGHLENPTYEQVVSGKTGHYEAVQVLFDPDRITYEQLLDIFWRHVDPTDPGGQFVDRGPQYRSAIFYHDDNQKVLAEQSKAVLMRSGIFDKPLATEILPFTRFYPAEDYHQDYHATNSFRYHLYRSRSGRDTVLDAIWKHDKRTPGEKLDFGAFEKPDDATLRNLLDPLQYHVTQQNGTEPPFDNPYWNNKQPGIYVDIVSGEPLFSSTDKFDSGTGWPSFARPLEPDHILEKVDRKLLMVRTEVRSRNADSHLGHVFKDGPPPTGLRYCINSAALRFVPLEKLAMEGYGRYLDLFEENSAWKGY